MMSAAQKRARGELLFDEPMRRHTTWRVGGPARRFYRPAGSDDLCEFLASLDGNETLMWLGLGSNLLVRDGGIDGTVIATAGVLDEIELKDEKTVRVEAGVSCAKTARFCVRQGLVGAEFLAGIPGTIGGALTMNAGAFGGEIWPLVKCVETVTKNGERKRRKAEDFRFGYRHVEGPAGEYFLSAELALEKGDAEAAAKRVKALLEKRNLSQPIGKPSCGSVFRNPPGDHAARLIEAAGLKGHCIGGACVSEKHANFILNRGDATASDIEALIEQVRDTVEERFGVRLETEVHIVGERVRRW